MYDENTPIPSLISKVFTSSRETQTPHYKILPNLRDIRNYLLLKQGKKLKSLIKSIVVDLYPLPIGYEHAISAR